MSVTADVSEPEGQLDRWQPENFGLILDTKRTNCRRPKTSFVEIIMATLPSDADKGLMVLRIYEHFGVRPDEVLMSNNFLAWAARNRVRVADVTSGLDYAMQEGWVSERPNGSLALTRAGFEMM